MFCFDGLVVGTVDVMRVCWLRQHDVGSAGDSEENRAELSKKDFPCTQPRGQLHGLLGGSVPPAVCGGVHDAQGWVQESRRETEGEAMETQGLDCRSIVTADAYTTHYAVVVIECANCWLPGQELPDEFAVVDVLVNGVCLSFAESIAEAANRVALEAGMRGRWAIAVPPGYVSPSRQ